MKAVPLNRLLIYARDIEAMVLVYEKHFGFEAIRHPEDRIVELVNPGGGMRLMLHQAGKGQRSGQSLVKLVFDVEDVDAFCGLSARNGLVFGPVHPADGYRFANAKDPCGNPVSVSSRHARLGGGQPS
ncbi:VOC family protein [Labrys neptuniae]